MTMPSESQTSLADIIFVGDSEMAGRMRSRFIWADGNTDYLQTSLGAIETWPSSLKTSIRIILGSRYPMFIWWGKDLINFYNDAYIPILGKRHPTALGQSAREIWEDIWPVVGPQADDVFNAGKPSWNEELLEIMERNGYPEETYFTFSYSPIGTDSGDVGGMFCACTEDTRRVLDDRRLLTLRELGAETAHVKTVREACQISADVLANNPKDIPFALIYQLDRDHHQAHLMSTTNLAVGTAVSPTVIDLADKASDCWSLNATLAAGESRVLDRLTHRFGPLPGGAWNTPPDHAIVLPLTRLGQETLGILIAGISPYRPLDDDYLGFFGLVAGQVTTAIANTLAYEEERKQAEALAELDRAKTAFFSNVSHEFRTPLTLMLGPAEDALADQTDPLSPNQRQRIEVVHRNGLRLLKLVNTLLDFSRIESDRLQATYESIDLATFTVELASVFRSATERAGLRLIIDCPPLTAPVYVDRDMWEKIVLNLLSNAFKFTFTGEITVHLHQLDNQVELSVRDTGIGIPAVEIPHLFERFHQIKGLQGRTAEGSGIGLSLVQALAKLHGGTVQVSSIEGEGSCFRVLIPTGCSHLPSHQIETSRAYINDCGRESPLSQQTEQLQNLPPPLIDKFFYLEEALRWLPQDHEAIAPDQHAHTTVAFSPTFTHNRASPSYRILLVDDNADMRDYVARLLSTRWQVETAANGAVAVNLIQQQLPDLVLADVMMPEVDGFQLLNTLRTNPITQSIPVILLSARAGGEETVEGLTAGADDYLIKPFSARELIARVETQLQMSRLRQEQSANRFKHEFLMTVTHELQTPLATILGWVRLLQTQVFDQKTLDALAAIERSATVEAKLIRNLLDVSHILSGKLQLKLQVVDVVALIKTVTATFRRTADQKNIQLTETTPQVAEIRVLADGDRLKQAIANVLDNAVKFTPNKGRVNVYVTVETHTPYVPSASSHAEGLQSSGSAQTSGARGAKFIQITITDTGIGISPDFIPYVFDHFSQAQVPSLHSPGGVGIELAIARYIVDLHKGTIQAQSAGLGQGTTFLIRLPLLQQATHD